MTIVNLFNVTQRKRRIIGERDRLLARFKKRIIINTDLNRKLVSFQGNKDQAFYGWFKYKEGFSASLVDYFLRKLAPKPGRLLDPFAGAGSALFAARDLGWRTTGIELLPIGRESIQARIAAKDVSVERFDRVLNALGDVDFSEYSESETTFNHVPITEGAFPGTTQKALEGYLAYCRHHIADPVMRRIIKFAALCVLEAISYTRKDGQYLRWDCRSNRSRGQKSFDKGVILPFDTAIKAKLSQMRQDIQQASLSPDGESIGSIDLQIGSCLDKLPGLRANTFDFVLTSPPYCNRYDYTRTYALELVFLGCGQADISKLRQQMLSCTVENNEKTSSMREAYGRRGQSTAWEMIDRTFREQSALQEVLDKLVEAKTAGELNNPNIPRMVRNYFYEMCFVTYEIGRVLKPGGQVVLVNDNVRYAGEEVPADLILSDFAESFGMRCRQIWTLPRGKGNSSQQMGNHGRTELRKCVYLWEKI